jgi:rubrerythrin
VLSAGAAAGTGQHLQHQKETTCVDPNRLWRLLADVDREHRAAMDAIEGVGDIGSVGRRGLVRGLGGLAAALTAAGMAVPSLASSAAAQESSTTAGGETSDSTNTTAAGQPGDTTGTTAPGTATTGGSAPGVATTGGGATTAAAPTSTAAATTTTLPPSRPQPSDLVFLAFAQSLELAAVQAYGLALSSTLLGTEAAGVALNFQNHHRDHAQAFAGIAGKAATGITNQSLLTNYTSLFNAAKTEADVLRAAFTVETQTASTYVAGLAQLLGTDPASLVASILPIETRHATVLGQVLGLSSDQYSPPFETTSAALSPEQYPIVER